jgi:hypothetical protein
MDSLVLMTLLFNSAGLAVFALAMALSYCRPVRRRPPQWVPAASDLPARAQVALQPHAAARAEAELAHAA